jgi:hypothetical protein
MPTLPLPPVPLKLQEMLKDYPDLIQELQDVLSKYVKKPNKLQPFDGAIWLLQDTLSLFVSEVHAQLEAAEIRGDQEAVQRARAKDFAVGHARLNMGGMPDLFDYFQVYKRVFT